MTTVADALVLAAGAIILVLTTWLNHRLNRSTHRLVRLILRSNNANKASNRRLVAQLEEFRKQRFVAIDVRAGASRNQPS